MRERAEAAGLSLHVVQMECEFCLLCVLFVDTTLLDVHVSLCVCVCVRVCVNVCVG